MERCWLILRRIETDGNNASCWHDEKLKQVETMLLKSSFKFYICENPFGEKSVQSFPCPYLASHTGSRWKAQPGWTVVLHNFTHWCFCWGIEIGADQAALSLLRKETKMRLLLLLVGLLLNNNRLDFFCTGHFLCCLGAFIWEPCTPARQVILMHLKS